MNIETKRCPLWAWSGLIAGVLLFQTGCNRPQTPEETAPGTEEPADAKLKPEEPSPPGAGEPSAAVPVAPAAPMAEPAGPSPYATAEILLNDLLARLKTGNLPGLFELAGPEVANADIQRKMTDLFLNRKFQVDLATPPVELSATGDSRKYGVPLKGPAELEAAGAQQFQMDLVRDPAKGWVPTAFYVPDIEAVLSAKMAAANPAPAPTPAPAAVEKVPVDVARGFLEAVVARDFRGAKLATDSARLTDEKLAALFIVVEEGSFKPHERNPLIATAAGDNGAWVIARLQSDREESDFGIEMERSGPESLWKVVGLNFSKLIQAAAMEAGAGDIAYTPIKTDLQGGDQLVLYFQYDDAAVNPRASKQLRIIADILKEDPKRMIHINGHTDAMGTVDYNESLSDTRAEAVRNILLAHGIPAGQIVTRAFGMSAPKAPNTNPDGTDNPTGRAQNRRAEVYLEF